MEESSMEKIQLFAALNGSNLSWSIKVSASKDIEKTKDMKEVKTDFISNKFSSFCHLLDFILKMINNVIFLHE